MVCCVAFYDRRGGSRHRAMPVATSWSAVESPTTAARRSNLVEDPNRPKVGVLL